MAVLICKQASELPLPSMRVHRDGEVWAYKLCHSGPEKQAESNQTAQATGWLRASAVCPGDHPLPGHKKGDGPKEGWSPADDALTGYGSGRTPRCQEAAGLGPRK